MLLSTYDDPATRLELALHDIETATDRLREVQQECPLIAADYRDVFADLAADIQQIAGDAPRLQKD